MTVTRRDDGRWRVRWRERVADEDGWRWASRERVVSDETTAQRLADKIRRARELGELPDLEPVRREPEVATVDDVLGGYLRQQAVRLSAGSIRAYLSDVERLLTVLRDVGRVSEGAAVPGGVLTRDTLIRCAAAFQRDRLSEATVYRRVRLLAAAWTWACDDPQAYPGLGPPPRDTRAALPLAPMYAGTSAPSLAECDACLRQLASNPRGAAVALAAATIARSTGLRTSQVFGLQVGDVNLAAATMVVRVGKSRREKAERRTVPFAPTLRDTLAELAAGRPSDALLVPRRGRASSPASAVIGAAWEAATVAGEVRREVWAPPNRVNARPRHAFRSAFIAHLRQAGVDRGVVKYLVGQALDLQERHYLGDGILPLAREAVATIPPIDWRELGELPSNVTKLR